jgi:hypothetical protein
VLAAAAIAAAAAPAAAPAASAGAVAGPAAPKGFFGVSGRNLSERDVAEMREAGVGTFRALFHFRWAKRGSKGFYNWAAYDRMVGRLASSGITLLPLLYGTPRWIHRDEATPPIRDEAARTEWARWLRKLVVRYGPNGMYWRLNPLRPYRPIRAWQIWNEPNDTTYWPPYPDPDEYAALLQVSAAAIRGIDPRATIVAAGVVAKPFSEGIPGPDYLAALAANPAARKTASRFAYHPYARNVIGVRRHLRRAREALVAGGAPNRPLWVTEVGWGSGGLLRRLLTKDEGGQARALRLTFRMMLRKRERFGIDRALWYYWRDHHDPRCFWCRTAGLLTNEHRPKLSFEAFEAFARR